MKITIRPFAGVKDICGFDTREMVLVQGCTVDEAVEQMVSEFPDLDDIRGSLLYAVNEEYADGGKKLTENDILALFPPVSGG